MDSLSQQEMQLSLGDQKNYNSFEFHNLQMIVFSYATACKEERFFLQVDAPFESDC